MSKVLIIGGGAAGMMAAIAAAYNGNEVHIFEKNEKNGKKLFITGKGRCNITNASDIENHFANIMRNSKFLYSAYHCLDSYGVCTMIESAGVETKIERGNRVFPLSDKSSDVIYALNKMMRDIGVNIHLKSEIVSVSKENENIILKEKNGKKHIGDACIIATGGISYPVTGSTGDGYKFAEKIGHTITERYPSLVPFNIKEEFCKELQGLSLKNVELKIQDETGKQYYSEMGEMLFTHFGISGPLVLSASGHISDKLKEHQFIAKIDLKPALSNEALDKRILKDFEENINRNFNNSLDKLLPKNLIPVIVELSGINQYKKVHEITKEERENLVKLIKELKMSISGARGFNEAIITKGGVSVKDINPKNMESKIVPGIYFAGEVLDIDALTGGYNLQVAWSTGYLAGSSIY
ncbi:NAD(P)/FAD-dependent oxidoreductase [Eubacterium sp. BX4]|uniref:NAD(P)/FAD-dependent oxidoreductase n=1 Tax=Eubacterium segne TaxID=2763045 RepID=A0ABR7F2W6_9FIRM|nr:NAD(P)/FAD-dependent oxidoreductase [Eubacterium segne]MBC5667953.1 NAD(P)/FAD-dependent oxidoreductase [Eubacterium segne]